MPASASPRIEPDQLVSCCSTPTDGHLTDERAHVLAQVFKALSDPTRVKLLSMIAAATDGEACICDMTEPVGLSQPTVSHHMSVLARAGLVTREQRGKWAYYALAPDARAALAGAVDQVTAAHEGAIA
ncbi:ArsR/SmtB family transcription factor [Pseudactinotalea suaedae]|uniref:ArsR/SmtB family transcription factor n=1 Tax=Pseudactinotalea suaedae TaxID=1524924 RepID=UPI0012E1EC60|nr:metalloregulator ArsR/SmtB family transcription factor [Pseudactinotalea suaedae]